MSANYQPQNAQVLVNTVNTSLAPSLPDATVFKIFDGTSFANGSIVTAVTIKALGSTSEGMIRIFSTTTASPSVANLLFEIRVPAAGQSGTYPAWGITVPCLIQLGSNGIVYATAQTITNNFVVTAAAFSVEGWS